MDYLRYKTGRTASGPQLGEELGDQSTSAGVLFFLKQLWDRSERAQREYDHR